METKNHREETISEALKQLEGVVDLRQVITWVYSEAQHEGFFRGWLNRDKQV